MRRLRSIPPAVVLALLVAAIGPGSAAAQAHAPRYKLIYAGSGTYAVDLLSPGGLRGHVAANFDWRVAYRPVAVSGRIYDWRKGTPSGGGTWSMASEEDGCSRSGPLRLLGDGGAVGDVQGHALQVLAFPGEGDYSSTDPGSLGGPCDTSDFWRQWVIDFSQVGATDAVDPLTSYFEIDKGRLKHHRKVQVETSSDSSTFSSLTPASYCGFGGSGDCVQSFAWDAKVTIKCTTN